MGGCFSQPGVERWSSNESPCVSVSSLGDLKTKDVVAFPGSAAFEIGGSPNAAREISGQWEPAALPAPVGPARRFDARKRPESPARSPALSQAGSTLDESVRDGSHLSSSDDESVHTLTDFDLDVLQRQEMDEHGGRTAGKGRVKLGEGLLSYPKPKNGLGRRNS